jgi:hypothetical protein
VLDFGIRRDRREAVFLFVPIMLQRMSPLLADIVAKVFLHC